MECGNGGWLEETMQQMRRAVMKKSDHWSRTSATSQYYALTIIIFTVQLCYIDKQPQSACVNKGFTCRGFLQHNEDCPFLEFATVVHNVACTRREVASFCLSQGV